MSNKNMYFIMLVNMSYNIILTSMSIETAVM